VFKCEIQKEIKIKETISTATNDVIKDNHWSFKGNYDFCQNIIMNLKLEYSTKLI